MCHTAPYHNIFREYALAGTWELKRHTHCFCTPHAPSVCSLLLLAPTSLPRHRHCYHHRHCRIVGIQTGEQWASTTRLPRTYSGKKGTVPPTLSSSFDPSMTLTGSHSHNCRTNNGTIFTTIFIIGECPPPRGSHFSLVPHRLP